MKSAWRRDLMCRVEGIDYDAGEKVGRVRMPDGACTDMGGAIRVFKKIDPGVRAIRTYSGGRLDTCYFLLGGEWIAFLPDEADEAEALLAASEPRGEPSYSY